APLIDQVRSVVDLEGETVLHYEILERLGGGGMGVVYKARDLRLGRTVALKFLSTHLLSDPEAKQRFLVEAQAAASLDHPNLCTIHEIGETEDGCLFIAMSYYEGETLQRRIGRGRISVEEALDITAQTSRGLARAAERGIIHRDIKPANLMLTADGTVKIVDFGLAKMMGGELTQAGSRLGTVSYMSPEQTRGDTADNRTDVWSVGVVLYEMLSGKRPFRGGTDQAVIHSILSETPTPPDALVPSLSPGVTALVERALRKDPARRYPDAASLLKDVERLIADPESTSPLDSTASLPADGERRLITVLACGISGFETLLDTLEPEAVDQELAQLRARVQGVVEDYGGVLNEFSEHQMIALFGVPVAHEDDALRAVRAALEIHEIHQGDRTKGGGVQLRSAVGSGHVAIRATEVSERPYRVGGTVGKDVFRLAATAALGEILVFPDLRRTVAPFVETEERAPVTLTPDGPPMTPLAVLGESEVDSRLEGSRPGTLTRFVGRTEELNTLIRALEGSNSGAGRVVSVVGDAGVGKSRLLHEFRATLADDSLRYVQGRCQAHGALTPFVPFIECGKAMLEMARCEPEHLHDHVVERTRSLAIELEIYLPVLLHLLSIESDEYALPEYLTGEDLRSALAEALVSLFTLGSRDQPLVLLLEDWHWSDGGSRDVLDQLAEMVSEYPLLLVVTARPELDTERTSTRRQIHLDLAPLDPSSAVEVMEASLGGAHVPEELAVRIGQKTGGNPFFIEELCHTLLETDAIVLEKGEARLADSIDRLTIPDTVQAVLKTRLDRLDPEAREVLRSASVIGRQFGLELLGRVVPSRARLEGVLNGLRSVGLIQRTSLVPEPTYRFKHALTLDVTYDSLLERQRKERHALVGEAIETIYEGRLGEFSEQLANHFACAEDWDRAVRYGFAAAERAASLWRIESAVDSLDRTHEWVEHRGGEDSERRATLVRLLLEEERHLETLGRRDRQQAVIDELLTLVPEKPTAERATVLVRQGELCTLLGRQDAAQEAFAAAIEVADACEAVDERAMALRGAGHLCWRLGLYDEALAPLTEVVEHDRVAAPPKVLLRDLVNLGRVRRELGEWEEAQAIGDEVRALAESTLNPADQELASDYMGHLLRTMGRPEEAIAAFAEGTAVASESHLPIRHSFHFLAMAAIHLEIGQTDQSLAAYEEAILLSRRASRADNLAHALILQADALMTIGRAADAPPPYEEAVAILSRLATDATLSATMGKLAKAYEATAQTDDASAAWRQAKDVHLALGDQSGALEAAEHEARLHAGDTDTVRELQTAALDMAITLGDHAAEARIRNSLAILAWHSGDLEGACSQYEATAKCLRSGEKPDGLGVVLNGWGAVLTKLGRHTDARSVLLEALESNRAVEDAAREADSLAALGASFSASDDFTQAYDWYQQCLDKRRAAEDRAGEGWALHRLAELSLEAETPERAEA
ncbi:MAG: serine/threonine-protein kinase PknK, partial [Longimicrobiales bacterium]